MRPSLAVIPRALNVPALGDFGSMNSLRGRAQNKKLVVISFFGVSWMEITLISPSNFYRFSQGFFQFSKI